jgi:citrate lyase beta subunit
MLDDKAYEEIDERLAPVDARLRERYPGSAHTRQPVHTLYVPADLFGRGVLREYSRMVLSLVREHGPLPFSVEVSERVLAKLATEPVEDLRLDFEDGYGIREDDEEDGHARAVATAVANGERTAFVGLRIKSLEGPTRRRAIRTLDVFLDALGPPPPGFVVTLPKVSDPAQVEAMVVLCGRLEQAYGMADRTLRFEVQVETPQAIVGADGAATVARLITAADGRCVGLHYGTYDYSASLGIAAQYQSLEHPVADHAKAVLQVAAAGTGVRVVDGSTNVLPVGSTADVRAAWDLHARLVRRALERGFYQGWDLNPAQLPTRYGATYTFYQEGRRSATERLGRYLSRRSAGILDEPATARAMAGFLLRGLDCGALDPDEVHFDRPTLENL